MKCMFEKAVACTLAVVTVVSLGGTSLQAATSGEYYAEPLSALSGVSIDDISSLEDTSMYNSASKDSLILQKPSELIMTDGDNFVRSGGEYVADVKNFTPNSDDEFKYIDAAVDYDGNTYDMVVVINDIVELENANNPHVSVQDDARITHEDVDVDFSIQIQDKEGNPVDKPLTMIFEDMDMMTEVGVDTTQVNSIIAPYTDQTSTSLFKAESYFDYDTLPAELIEMNMNPNASEEMKHERLRYDVDGTRLNIFDGWNTMHKFNQVENPYVAEVANNRYFKDIKFLGSSEADILNLQNTPEQNFSVEFKSGTVDLHFSQNVEAFGGRSASENNMYLASPNYIGTTCNSDSLR